VLHFPSTLERSAILGIRYRVSFMGSNAIYIMREAISRSRHVSLPIQSILVKLINSRSCHQCLPPTGSIVTKACPGRLGIPSAQPVSSLDRCKDTRDGTGSCLRALRSVLSRMLR
jgi:hypothetical protein